MNIQVFPQHFLVSKSSSDGADKNVRNILSFQATAATTCILLCKSLVSSWITRTTSITVASPDLGMARNARLPPAKSCAVAVYPPRTAPPWCWVSNASSITVSSPYLRSGAWHVMFKLAHQLNSRFLIWYAQLVHSNFFRYDGYRMRRVADHIIGFGCDRCLACQLLQNLRCSR